MEAWKPVANFADIGHKQGWGRPLKPVADIGDIRDIADDLIEAFQ